MADFFIGEYLLLLQESAWAAIHLRMARETCPPSFVQYDGAAAEMRRLGLRSGAGK
jgi:hypothetical protein